MILQLSFWFFEIGVFFLFYCIINIVKLNYFRSDQEFFAFCYSFCVFITSLIGSSFTHPLIAFLDKNENSEKQPIQKTIDNDQDEILNKNGFKKIEIKNFESKKLLFNDDIVNVDFEENEADSETPLISNQTKQSTGLKPNFMIPSKIEYKKRYETNYHQFIRCIINSFLISVIFSAEFLYLIQFILFKISNFSCLFILLDFISTLSFSIYININQIKKQIKNGNGNTNSLISSTLLSGPFLFIFSLLFYEKNKEKNPYLTFRCFASISSFFCISVSFIFPSLTFIIIFYMFVHQHKTRNHI